MADGDWANAIAEDEGKLSNQVDLNLYLKRLFFETSFNSQKGDQALRSSNLPKWKLFGNSQCKV